MTKLNVREFLLITTSLMLTGMGFLYADTTPLDGVQSKVTVTPIHEVDNSAVTAVWTIEEQEQPQLRLP